MRMSPGSPPAFARRVARCAPDCQNHRVQPSDGTWEFTSTPSAPGESTESEDLANPPVRLRRRTKYLGLALVVVGALAVGSWWFFLRSSSIPIKITYSGTTVNDPGAVLTTAQHNLAALVKNHDGQLKGSSRCYFQRPTKSARRSPSDVANTLLCGPVLFFDGEATHPYLSYRLSMDRTEGNAVRLNVEDRPIATHPEAAPAGVTLVRPDGTSEPLSTAGMAVPIPPSAAADVLQAVEVVHPVHLRKATRNAVMGSNAIKIRLDEYGPVRDYGEGTDERSAPPHQRLIGFRAQFDGGENTLVRRTRRTSRSCAQVFASRPHRAAAQPSRRSRVTASSLRS
jgi:hypothetical protein